MLSTLLPRLTTGWPPVSPLKNHPALPPLFRHPFLSQPLRSLAAGTWTGLGAACWDCGWLPVGVVAG